MQRRGPPRLWRSSSFAQLNGLPWLRYWLVTKMRYDVTQNLDRAATLRQGVTRWVEGNPDVVVTEASVNLVGRFIDPAGGAERYLRMIHRGHRAIEQICAELEFVTHLKQRGCDVAAPIASSQGKLV